jgi:UDP-N-acetylglucosamine 2-epimerase (non-hydrolysing)
MPEEVNRIATDAIADLLWTPSPDADENLIREGIGRERISQVGNIMIDSLEMMRTSIEAHKYYEKLGLEVRGYGVVTLHRPSNVDDAAKLGTIVQALIGAARRLPCVFPVHPRTRGKLKQFGLLEELTNADGILLTDPLGYTDFMSLAFGCAYALTDSGGIQEETSYLGIPCITLRDNTERPITVSHGTNQLAKPAEVEGLLAKW